jgi:hypothetical protein
MIIVYRVYNSRIVRAIMQKAKREEIHFLKVIRLRFRDQLKITKSNLDKYDIIYIGYLGRLGYIPYFNLR